MTRTSSKRLPALLAALALTAVACSSDSDGTTDTTAGGGAETTVEAGDTATSADGVGDEADGPATSPSSITAEEQTSDGFTIVVASISLPSPGFIAVHGDGGGSPGAVIGHSDLLPAGESTDVTVTLDEPLTESGVVFPMAHIDVDEDGVYDFAPPDETTDSPGTTDSGDVAVVSAQITVG